MLSEQENENEGITLSSRFFGFLILGVALVFVGIVVLVVASLFLGNSGSVGVVIFIGPFPIVFGSGPDAGWLILIGIILAVVSIALFLVMNRRFDWV
ncbi:MAG TPA: DUF131 domain-containing protein [Verrucomicrobiae bacterium]|nr:DUF131 domain-containing protein [Verrucomicrobiae bacterium]